MKKKEAVRKRHFVVDGKQLVEITAEKAEEIEQRNIGIMECSTDQWERFRLVYTLDDRYSVPSIWEEPVKALLVLAGAGACIVGEIIGTALAYITMWR